MAQLDLAKNHKQPYQPTKTPPSQERGPATRYQDEKETENQVKTVKSKIEQIFTDYDETAADTLMDIDGLKQAIKQGLLTLAHNIQEAKVQTTEESGQKIAEIEVKMSDNQKEVTKMVKKVADKTNKLE